MRGRLAFSPKTTLSVLFSAGTACCKRKDCSIGTSSLLPLHCRRELTVRFAVKRLCESTARDGCRVAMYTSKKAKNTSEGSGIRLSRVRGCRSSCRPEFATHFCARGCPVKILYTPKHVRKRLEQARNRCRIIAQESLQSSIKVFFATKCALPGQYNRQSSNTV